MVFHGSSYLSAQFGNGLRFELRNSLIRSRILRRLRYKVSIRRFIPLTSYSYHSSGTWAAYRQSSSRAICSARVSAGSNDSHAVTFSYTRCRAYATQPRKDKRNNLFVSAEVPNSQLGISAINLRCEALRDYFYVGNRRRGWDRQSSFYKLLQVNPKVSPAELRLAFKLRTLELSTTHPPTGDLRALNRPLNIL